MKYIQKIARNSHGFTIVEMAIIVPIVLIVIGVFINAIISMTGEVLISRTSDSMLYDIQNTLTQIEQDVSMSGGFLAVNNFALSMPQGYNNDTTDFTNSNNITGNALILNSYNTINNPNDVDKKIIYLSNQPNQCNSNLSSNNEKLMMNIVYFTKTDADGTVALWRRVLAPANYEQSTCGKPWQQPTCAIGQTGSSCKTDDMKMVSNISALNGFDIRYYTDSSSETPIANATNTTLTNSQRQAAISTARSIAITISTSAKVKGEIVTQTSSTRTNNDNENINASTIPAPCPVGFIVVPGSVTYGTNDFCIMKYEAKITGNNNGTQTYNSTFVPESRATGTPWVNISQVNAITESQTVCTGCHLLTEQEWMTVAQNVISVPSNWSGGSVGNGYIFNGHNDSSPDNTLAAADDNSAYSGTGQSYPSNQRRTLTLTNGEVIWDFAGNVAEFINETISAGMQPGLSTDSAYSWKEWNNPSLTYSALTNPAQPYTIGQQNISSWTSANGIGRLYSTYNGTGTARAHVRGGSWNSGNDAGVLMLYLGMAPTDYSIYVTFRVAR